MSTGRPGALRSMIGAVFFRHFERAHQTTQGVRLRRQTRTRRTRLARPDCATIRSCPGARLRVGTTLHWRAEGHRERWQNTTCVVGDLTSRSLTPLSLGIDFPRKIAQAVPFQAALSTYETLWWRYIPGLGIHAPRLARLDPIAVELRDVHGRSAWVATLVRPFSCAPAIARSHLSRTLPGAPNDEETRLGCCSARITTVLRQSFSGSVNGDESAHGPRSRD